MSFFIFMGFVFEVHFVLYEYSYCFLSFLFEWNVFFPPLTFHIGASCRQHIVGSCFIVQSSLLYLLIAAFILLAFKVIIYGYVFVATLNLVYQDFIFLLCSFLLDFPFVVCLFSFVLLLEFFLVLVHLLYGFDLWLPWISSGLPRWLRW